MLTSLPRIKEPKGNSGESVSRPRDRKRGISQVGKVFPKNPVQEELDRTLDLLGVGLEKDKDVSLPAVEFEIMEERVSAPAENLDSSEVALPGIPGILGGRRFVPLASSPEPVDLLVKGEAQRKFQPQDPLEAKLTVEPESAAVKVMRSNLEPLIDSLFEEDEFFAQDFEDDGLNRVLFIRKLGIYVEIKSKDYIPGVICTPLFHCPRCKDNWTNYGKVPEDCPFPRQLTRAPAIHMASNRKRHNDPRKRRMKRRLGDIKEGFVVSGSGTVLNDVDEHNSGENPEFSSAKNPLNTECNLEGAHGYATVDDKALESLNLREIDLQMMREVFGEFPEDSSVKDGVTAKSLAETLGFDEEQYDVFARVAKGDSANEKFGSLHTTLDSLTVNDLPPSIKEKLLSILRRQKRTNQVSGSEFSGGYGRKAVEGSDANGNVWNGRDFATGNQKNGGTYVNGQDSTMRRSSKGSSFYVNVGDSAVVKTSKRRNSYGNRGRGKGNDEIRKSGDQSALARRTSNMANDFDSPLDLMDSSHYLVNSDDEEEVHVSPSASPSVVLAYKELQKQRRAKKRNAAVKNRTGQPDTPYQRLGRPSVTVPNNSAVFGYDDGDSDEEAWGQARTIRIGSSRAQISDSRTAMLRRYSRALDTANSDDQLSLTTMADSESYAEYPVEPNGPLLERRRRTIVKKERAEAVQRPRRYHSKIIDDLPVGQGTPSRSHITVSYSKASVNNAPDEKTSVARISLTDARRSLSRGSSATIRRFLRSESFLADDSPSVKNSRKQLTSPIPHVSEVIQEPCASAVVVENLDQMDRDESSLLQVSDATNIDHVQDKPVAKPKPVKLGKRASQTKSTFLYSFDDFRGVQRLPISSPFTYSFYELPSQHRAENESIILAASRIGRPKKSKKSDHFRSRSAP